MPTGIYIRTQKNKKTYFKKGMIPWNKGLKGIRMSISTQFKKGFSPWNKGKKMSEDCRRKNSIAHLGYKPSKENIALLRIRMTGKDNPNFGKPINPFTNKCLIKSRIGKKRSIEIRRKISESLKGSKSYLWRGGVTVENLKIRNSLESKLWREAVFKRDNWTCVLGGISHGNRLNADHIKPFSKYPELRFEIDNGRTLCIDCHRKTETWGRKLLNKNIC